MYKTIFKKCKMVSLLSSILIDSDNLNDANSTTDRKEICIKAFIFLNHVTKDEVDLIED